MLARLVMRGIAFEAGGSEGFSIGGTLEVIALGVIIGTPVALLFEAHRRISRRSTLSVLIPASRVWCAD